MAILAVTNHEGFFHNVTFQDLIFTLQQFWAGQGCVVQQPYDTQMGAGTFHPATFLRVLDDHAWSSAYVQPCRRPTDGRYGKNPNRMQPLGVGFVEIVG